MSFEVKTNENLDMLTGIVCPACKKSAKIDLVDGAISQEDYEDILSEAQIMFHNDQLVCNYCNEVSIKIRVTLEVIE